MSIPEPQQPASTEGASQGPDRPVKIALVLYPRFTGLDIIGPFQVLASVPAMTPCSWPPTPGRSSTAQAAAR